MQLELKGGSGKKKELRCSYVRFGKRGNRETQKNFQVQEWRLLYLQEKSGMIQSNGWLMSKSVSCNNSLYFEQLLYWA